MTVSSFPVARRLLKVVFIHMSDSDRKGRSCKVPFGVR